MSVLTLVSDADDCQCHTSIVLAFRLARRPAALGHVRVRRSLGAERHGGRLVKWGAGTHGDRITAWKC